MPDRARQHLFPPAGPLSSGLAGRAPLAVVPPGPARGAEPLQLQGPLEPAILHIRITDFAALVELHARPSLAGRQLIVCDEASARGMVLAALPAAHAQGVAAGMALRVAEKLCAHPVVVEVDPGRLLLAAQAVQALLHWYTPLVEPAWLRVIQGAVRPDTAHLARGLGAWLDVRGCTRLWGPAASIGYLLSVSLGEQGYTALVGVATNPGLAAVASALARSGEPLVVPAGQERTFLADLPLQSEAGVDPLLDLDPTLVEHLELLGIRRLGDLARLPAPALRRRFGAAGEAAQAQARGEVFRQLTIPILPETLQATRHLDDPCDDRLRLQRELGALAEELAIRLAKQGRAAARITLHATTAQGTSMRSLHLKQPVATATAIQARAVALLAQLLPSLEPSSLLQALALELDGFGPAAAQLALPLFGAGAPAGAVDLVAARLRGRFGSRAARRVHLVPDALLPEEQVLWDGPGAQAAPKRQTALAVHTAACGTPVALRRGQRAWEQVRSVHSQWRVRTRWWADPVHRHYYVVELAGGAVLELYRDLPDGPWHLSGRRD